MLVVGLGLGKFVDFGFRNVKRIVGVQEWLGFWYFDLGLQERWEEARIEFAHNLWTVTLILRQIAKRRERETIKGEKKGWHA